MFTPCVALLLCIYKSTNQNGAALLLSICQCADYKCNQFYMYKRMFHIHQPLGVFLILSLIMLCVKYPLSPIARCALTLYMTYTNCKVK